jgi:hypothetical protein
MKSAEIEVFNATEVYDFKTECFDENLLKVYQKIDKTFKDLLNKYAKTYGIKNCIFYFDNLRYCSSSATNIGNRLNIIKLSCAYPNLMYNKLFLKNELENNQTISTLYFELLNDNFDLKDFFLECSLRFTFFHELRHLIQFENKSNIFSEKPELEFSLERHIYELDADLFAIRYILDYVFDAYEKLDSKTEKNFNSLLNLALASVISTYLLFYFKDIDYFNSKKISKFIDVFCTNSKTHPHNLIRVINIVEFYGENIRANYPITQTNVDYIKYSFEIVNIFLQETIESDFNLTRFYFDELEKNLIEINLYVRLLSDISEKHEKIARIREKYNNVL